MRGHVHTNTVEGFFSLLKRGINGTFHHVGRGHLHRYCAEFAFRYNNRIAVGVNDGERAKTLVLGAEGKRLTYAQPADPRPVFWGRVGPAVGARPLPAAQTARFLVGYVPGGGIVRQVLESAYGKGPAPLPLVGGHFSRG